MTIEMEFGAELIINCFMHHFHKNIPTNVNRQGEIMI
jgi:hypothetical protein